MPWHFTAFFDERSSCSGVHCFKLHFSFFSVSLHKEKESVLTLHHVEDSLKPSSSVKWCNFTYFLHAASAFKDLRHSDGMKHIFYMDRLSVARLVFFWNELYLETSLHIFFIFFYTLSGQSVLVCVGEWVGVSRLLGWSNPVSPVEDKKVMKRSHVAAGLSRQLVCVAAG